jgi:hypothetical protein
MHPLINYTKIGLEHVLPLGYDHVLFVLALFLFDSRLKTAIIQCSLFTLAHSITLALVALKFVSPPTLLIETCIAFSIALMAIENIILKKVNFWRLILIFVFGLVHGMGFANALLEAGLDNNEMMLSLIGFNCGVEIAQILIILGCYIIWNKLIVTRIKNTEKLSLLINWLIAITGITLGIQRLLS